MVVSVHSIVGLDFAAGIAAGWHSTQWPPYFFIGALYSGWAATLMLIIPLRRLYRLERIITERHLEVISKLMLATGLMLAYCYALEAFQPFYRGDPAERHAFLNGVFGLKGGAFWVRNTFNIFLPQLLWLPAIRHNKQILWLLSLGIVFGMWFERFNFVVTALAHDYIPSEWGTFNATIWDEGILYGSIGLVFVGFLLFIRLLPVVSMFELREVLHRKGRE